MSTEHRTAFRPDWPLAQHLRANGFEVELVVRRTDGAALSEADRKHIDAAAKALAVHDREVYLAWVAQAPSSPLEEAAPKPATAKKAPKAAPKPRRAAKRPA